MKKCADLVVSEVDQIQTVKDWVKEIANDIQMRVLINIDTEYGVMLYTGDRSYFINVYPRRNYLGCVMLMRYKLPGEDKVRGDTIYEGTVNRETWDKIVAGILKTEFEKNPKE